MRVQVFVLLTACRAAAAAEDHENLEHLRTLGANARLADTDKDGRWSMHTWRALRSVVVCMRCALADDQDRRSEHLRMLCYRAARQLLLTRSVVSMSGYVVASGTVCWHVAVV